MHMDKVSGFIAPGPGFTKVISGVLIAIKKYRNKNKYTLCFIKNVGVPLKELVIYLYGHRYPGLNESHLCITIRNNRANDYLNSKRK